MNENLKTAFRQNIAQLIALGVIITVSVANIFIEDELISSGLMAIQWVAIGIQWISISRNYDRRKIERMLDDKKRFTSFLTSNAGVQSLPLSSEFDMHFMVPYTGAWHERLWHKFGKRKTPLSLYRFGHKDTVGSYTKLFADNKEMFEMQLRGFIDTTNPEMAVKALDFLRVEGKWDLTA